MDWLIIIVKYIFMVLAVAVTPGAIETSKQKHRVTSVVVFSLIFVNVAVYLVMLLGDWFHHRGFYNEVISRFGFNPARLVDGTVGHGGERDPLSILATGSTIITHQFLHGGIAHLAGNMYALYMFGSGIESGQNIKFRGRDKRPYNTYLPFLIFYLLCGTGAVFFHFLVAYFFTPQALNSVLVGASGAISGLIGAYLLGMWTDYNRVRLSIFFFFFGFETKVNWYIIYWIALQASLLLIYGANGAVSFSAHVGGFITGCALWYAVCPWVGKKVNTRARGWFRKRLV